VNRPPIDVVLAEDAVEQLARWASAQGWREALVVMDANTEEAAGARVVAELRDARIDVHEYVFGQRTGLLAGELEVAQVRSRLRAGLEPVAVGSGVITDIVRYAADSVDRDFVSVPTAASMDGYASSVAALQLGGAKVTFPARAPRAIFADPRVAAAAPVDLTRSGIGDLLAKATAGVDWLAAHLLYDEAYSEEVADLVLEPLSFAAANAEAVLTGDAEAVAGLLTGLVQSGIAMAIAGSSRPASGCEHHASHFWDLLAARGMRPHHPHGLQVGYASRFAIGLQQFAFAGGVASLRRPVLPTDPLGPAAREWLGEPSVEIVVAVEEKQRFAGSLGSWPSGEDGWDAVRARLAPALARFGDVERALTRARIPAAPGYLDVDERTLRATLRYASRLRARYTVIDFLEGQGVLEDAIEEVLGQAG
jgi:glycerol-1-phosphate dehydrogenase [NAD(P)+]